MTALEELRAAKRFVAYYYCNGACISLGVSICFTSPNIEIHLPFGFVRIGWVTGPRRNYEGHPHRFLYRTWGIE